MKEGADKEFAIQRLLGFCCKKCLAKFKKDPAAALARK